MPLSRKKSCVPCRRAKARCDLSVPSCSRCHLRNRDCVYEGESRVTPVPWLQSETEELPFDFLQSAQSNRSEASSGATMLDSPRDLEWLRDEIDLSAPMDAFTPKGLDIPVQDRIAPQFMPMENESFTTETLMSSIFPNSLTVTSDNSAQIQRSNSGPRGTLQRRQVLKDGVLFSITVGQMTSYPKMMIQGDTLPPFISPPCFSREDLAPDCAEAGYHRCLPEDLAVCTSFVRMYYERTTANKKYIWQSIYAETARLYAAVCLEIFSLPFIVIN